MKSLLMIFLKKKKTIYIKKKQKKNFVALFYGWGSTASRLEPFQGGSLLFSTKFPGQMSHSGPENGVISKLWIHSKNIFLI